MMHIFFCIALSFLTFSSFAQEYEGDVVRGYLPVPVALDYQQVAQNVKVLTPTVLGTTTTNLCESIEYRIAKSVEFRPNGALGVPMMRAIASGATLNLGHNSLSMYRANDCSSFGVGLEVGYSPNALGSNTQPHTIIVENGVFSDWNIAILVHAGVRNVILRNLVLVDNTIPIVVIGRNSAPNVLQTEVITVTLENVIIVNSNTDQLKCLNWVRSYLTDGTSVGTGIDAITASNSCGYVQGEVMPRENSPFTGTLAALEVYTGMYMYGVTNINIKNVSVSNIGFNGTPATLHTGAYGMWFRNCRSVFMEDVEATKVQSAVATAGLYFDDCEVVSIINAELSNNSTTQVTVPGMFTATPEQLWAAAMVLKDSDFINVSDVVMSKTSATFNVWGLRTILSTNIILESIEITRAWADGLRADRVYGIDLGDLYRNHATNGRLPAKAVNNAWLSDISIAGARGKNVETTVATEFKGLFLGDGSSNIDLNGIAVEGNSVNAAATGVNSGIEFGSLSTTGDGINGGTGKALGTMKNLVMSGVSVANNSGGLLTGRFVGIRGRATGTAGGLHTPAVTDNILETIHLADSTMSANTFDGIRMYDESTTTPLIVKDLLIEVMDLSNSVSGSGITLQNMSQVQFKASMMHDNAGNGMNLGLAGTTSRTITFEDISVFDNAGDGIYFDTAVSSVLMRLVDSVNNTGNGILAPAIDTVEFDGVRCLSNGSLGFSGAALTNAHWKKVHCNNNVGGGVFLATIQDFEAYDIAINNNGGSGFFVSSSVRNLLVDRFTMTSNVAFGMYLPLASGVSLKNGTIGFMSGTIGCIYFPSTVIGLLIDSMLIHDNSSTSGSVSGINIVTSGSNIQFKDVSIARINTTTSTSSAIGIAMRNVQNLLFERVEVNSSTSTGASALSAAYGFYFDASGALTPSVRNLKMRDCRALGTTSSNGNATGCLLTGGVGIEMETVDFSGSNAANGSAVGLQLNTRTDIGIESLKINNFISSNQQGATASYGIYLNPTVTGANVYPLAHATLQSGFVDNNVATAGAAAGIFLPRSVPAPNLGALDVVIDHLSVSKNRSIDGDCHGVRIESGQNVTLKNIEANSNNSALSVAAGPFTTRGIYLERSVVSAQIECTQANQNSAANGSAFGVVVQNPDSLMINGLWTNNNQAKGSAVPTTSAAEVKGLFIDLVSSTECRNLTLCNIEASRNSNAHRAYGIHIENAVNATLKNIDASYNVSDVTGLVNGLPVLSQAIGLYLDTGNKIACENITASGNTQTETTAANLSTVLAPVTATDSEANRNTSASIARHFPVLQISGAYGLLAQSCTNLVWDIGLCDGNNGVRAFGAHFKNCAELSLSNLTVRDNIGLGTPFFSDTTPFATFTNTAVTIPAAQRTTLFGSVGAGATINLRSAYQGYLVATSKIRNYLQRATTGAGTDWTATVAFLALTSAYTHRNSSYVAGELADQDHGFAYNALMCSVASFRRFCTGIGLGIFNSQSVVVRGCQSLANRSLFDSAGAIVSYGTTKDLLVEKCIAASSQCWYNSERGGTGTFNIDGDINITAWQPLYTFVVMGLMNSETVQAGQDDYGFVALPNTIVQATHIVGAGTRKPTAFQQPNGAAVANTWLITPRAMTVGFPAGALPTGVNQEVPLYNFVGVGPIAVGIHSEADRSVEIKDNSVFGNQGHAALGVGILMDSSTESQIVNNEVHNNQADALGYGMGVIDIALSMSNQWWGNVISANRYDTFLNMNFIVPFDAALVGAFRYVRQNNGNVTNTAATERTSYLNMIIEFRNLRQKQDFLSNCIKTRWENAPLVPGTLGSWGTIIPAATANETLYVDELSAC